MLQNTKNYQMKNRALSSVSHGGKLIPNAQEQYIQNFLANTKINSSSKSPYTCHHVIDDPRN